MTEGRFRREELEAVADAVQRFQRIRTSKRVHAALTDAADVDLTQQSLQLLVAAVDGCSASDVARATGMDAGAVSRELRKLEVAGMITREQSSHHHTSVVIRMTDEGRSARERVTAVRHDHLSRALVGWERAEVEVLARLLDRFVDDLQANPLQAER